MKNVAGAAYIYQSNMSFNDQYLKTGNIRFIGIDSTEFFQTVKIHLATSLKEMPPDQVYSALTEQPGNILLQDNLAGISPQMLETQSRAHSKIKTQTIEKSFKVTARAAKVVDDLDQRCRFYGYNTWIGTTEDAEQRTQGSYNQAEMLVFSVTTFSIIVSALGIMAAMVYTILERKREIGLLMALGLKTKQNMMIIIGETVLLSLLGTTIGMGSGIGLSYFVVQVIPWWTRIPQPPLAFSPHALLVAAATIIIAALVSAVYPANRVAKLNIVDALRK